MSSVNKDEWMGAMKNEITSLHKNDTWELVKLPSNRSAIGSKWVYKIKSDKKGNFYKARLVAQGFSQKFGTDYDEVFAPVARQATLKILLSIAGHKNFPIYHLDAKTAFLNGILNETIYMRQPPGFETEGKENHVCLLKKSLYGLKQSARVWNQKLHQILISMGMKQSSFDACLYTYKDQNRLLYMVIYVDDILMTSDSQTFLVHIEAEFKKHFVINNLGMVTNYLGIRIQKNGYYYLIDQEKYINHIISEFGLNDAKISQTPLDVAYMKDDSSDLLPNNERYRKAIGCLLYVAINTRPDISASVTILAQRVAQPRQRDWLEVKRIIRYLKGTASNKLKLGCHQETQLVGFSDADWGEDRQTRRSNSGFVFFFGGPISWACRKQTCVAQSSTEAEFIALAEASKECIWLRNILRDFSIPISGPTTINEDNQSCIQIVHDEKFNMRTKHIDIKSHHIKDNITKGILRIVFCPSGENTADILTKPLQKARFCELKAKFNLN